MGSVTLELTEAAFCKWRNERSSRAELIPESLWDMALGLYPQHKRSKICKGLGLSASHFNRRLADYPKVAVADNGFVLASRDEIAGKIEHSPAVQLTIQGKERALTLCVDVHALSQVLPHIGALL